MLRLSHDFGRGRRHEVCRNDRRAGARARKAASAGDVSPYLGSTACARRLLFRLGTSVTDQQKVQRREIFLRACHADPNATFRGVTGGPIEPGGGQPGGAALVPRTPTEAGRILLCGQLCVCWCGSVYARRRALRVDCGSCRRSRRGVGFAGNFKTADGVPAGSGLSERYAAVRTAA
jgi:hypothetical protein